MKLYQKLEIFRIYDNQSKQKYPKNIGPRSEKLVFNSILNFRRETHFWLRLLETQVAIEEYIFLYSKMKIIYEDFPAKN